MPAMLHVGKCAIEGLIGLFWNIVENLKNISEYFHQCVLLLIFIELFKNVEYLKMLEC